jgi:hypothetical protein
MLQFRPSVAGEAREELKLVWEGGTLRAALRATAL